MTTISTTDFTDGVTSRSSSNLDTNFSNCATVLNGNVDNANFVSNAGIDVSKIGGGSDGQILARFGGTNGFFGSWLMLANVELSGNAASIDFTNIPQAFFKLVALHYVRGTEAVNLSTYRVRFNGDTGNNYYYAQNVNGSAGFTHSQAQAQSSMLLGQMSGANATSGWFTSGELVIPGYNQAKTHSCHRRGAVGSSAVATALVAERMAGLWNSAVAITSMSFFPGSGSFVTGSRIVLYGVS